MAELPVVIAYDYNGVGNQIGSGNAPGVVPENLGLSSNDKGPDTCTFTLRRDPRDVWDDLQPGSPIEVQIEGVTVWSGRVDKATGAGREKDQQISVTCRGWQDHLADDMVDEYWVHSKLSDWRDGLSFPNAELQWGAGVGKASAGSGVMQIGWAKGDVIKTSDSVGVTLDLGPNRTAKRVVVVFDLTGGQTDNFIAIRTNASDDYRDGAAYQDIYGPTALTSFGGGPNTISGTSTIARRYVTVYLIYSGAGGTYGADNVAKIKSAMVFDQLRDESGNASILKASNVVSDLVGVLPHLIQSTARIEATALAIPDFAPDGPRTMLELIQSVNAYHDFRYGVDADKQLVFQSRPTDAKWECGEYSGDPFQDAAIANLSDLYNKVFVNALQADGSIVSRIVVQSNAILNRQGISRSKRLELGATVTNAGADAIGALWLASKATSPTSGSIQVKAGGDLRLTQGGTAHPSTLLRSLGDKIKLTDRVDPVTSAVGRDATIVGVGYDADTETATVSLDNTTNRIETFLGRLAAVQGTG